MSFLLRKLAIYLCAPIYKLIPQIYNIFYLLANHRFLEDDTISRISSNIYILVSVIMLFAFSANILAAIANPDLLTDKKKGLAALFKRAIIGLALIVLIPFAFDEAYNIQNEVMSKGLIEKVVVGLQYTGSNNGGQVLAGTLINSVLHPVDDTVEVNEDVAGYYESMVTKDIRDIELFKMHINVAGDGSKREIGNGKEDFAFEFDGLIAIIAGFACCYFLIIFALDMAVRIFKLAFLELTAPIIVVSYMAAGDNILKKWGKELLTTFLDVFIRIVAMAFCIFIAGNLDGFVSRLFDTADEGNVAGNVGVIDKFFLMVLLIIGMLIFVKQILDLVNRIFDTNLQSKGGVSGRLGQMAVGGKLAQGAWNAIRNAGMLGLTAAGLALPTGIAAGAGYAGNRLTNGGVANALRTAGRVAGKASRAVGSAYNNAAPVVKGFANGNPFNAIQSAMKGYRDTPAYQNERRRKWEDARKDAGLNEYGKLGNSLSAAQNALDSLLKSKSISVLPKSQRDALTGLMNAQVLKDVVSQLSDKKEKGFTQVLEKMRSDSADKPDVLDNIRNAEKLLNDGDLRGAQSILSSTNGINSTLKDEFTKNIKEYQTALKQGLDENIGLDKVLDANGITLNPNNITIDDVGKVLKGVKGVTGASDAYFTSMENAYNGQLEKANDSQKETMNIYKQTSEDMSKEYARLVTKDWSSNTQQTSQQGGQTSQQSAQPTQQQSTQTSDSQNQNLNIDFSDSSYANSFIDPDDYNIHSNGSFKLKGDNSNTAGSSQQSTQSSQQQNTQPSPQGGSTTSQGQTVINNYYGSSESAHGENSTVNVEGLDGLFDNLGKTIDRASNETNKILNDQLAQQQQMNNTMSRDSNKREAIKDNLENINEHLSNIESSNNSNDNE